MNKMILCTDDAHGIGKNGTIPWHSSDDFAHFKQETQGKKILMGYKTWQSLPYKPLRDRVNIVVTSRRVSDETLSEHKDVIFINKSHLGEFLRNNDGIVVIGGSTIYQAALPYVDEIILSVISGDYDCDTFFDVHASDVHVFVPKSTKTLSDGVQVFYLHRTLESIAENADIRWF
ncbi:hypothetical protein pEaSNUABM49_00311 [Erwinia phage pEa_SNUABM_49]|nr:hypothetical protein pEaSNUABM49_00311 [Erwinia phage pEa_SNUABM_49]